MRDLMFTDHDLRSVMEHQAQSMAKEVENYDQNALLNSLLDELVKYFEEKYRLVAPRLLEDQISVDEQEVQIDARNEPGAWFLDDRMPIMVTGTRVTLYVPFTGDHQLFRCRPSTFTLNPPRGTVRDTELVLTRVGRNFTSEALQQGFRQELAQIRQYLGHVERDVQPFNESLAAAARTQIGARRQKLIESRGVVASLGFPIRRRADAPNTYAPPVVRRRIPAPPPPTGPAVQHTPSLPTQEYDHILSVLQNMAHVLERSPSAFAGMDEESLRQHFLVQLNAQYEGHATAETFNMSGKTDILLRVKDGNIFVAECKFWQGTAEFAKAIDQLLRYLTWRDTKSALLVFNRRRNFGEMVAKAKETLRTHVAFRRELPYSIETGLRCILSHPEDPQRDVTVTMLAFDVPAPEPTGAAPPKAPSTAKVEAEASPRTKKRASRRRHSS